MNLEFYLAGKRNVNEVSSLGVALKQAGDTLHIGLIYKVADDPPVLYHMEWHHRISHSDVDAEYSWIQSKLSPDKRRLVAVGLKRFAERGSMPVKYSPHYDGGPYFNPEGCEYIRHGFGVGLTCSTFVLAMHQAFGITLIQASTWPASRPDDELQLIKITGRLRQSPNNDPFIEQHIKAIQLNPNSTRFRPSEVASAAGSKDVPVCFKSIVKDAARIEGKLMK